MTAAHSQTETLKFDVRIPAHADRVTTPLFRKTRAALIEREHGRCWICGRTAEESGHPLEAHHHPVERSLAELVDWELFMRQAVAGDYGPHPQAFDWAHFDADRWEEFVDNMLHNGLLACKDHHVGADEGVHTLPLPIWIAQRFARDGYRFNSREVIHRHEP